MRTNDLLMILGCLALGYVLVAMALNKPKKPPVPPQAPRAAPSPRAEPTPPHWSEVLEIPRDAGVDQIREAYRRRISEYHPDKVAALGRELRELADAKSKDIGTAYARALQERRASS